MNLGMLLVCVGIGLAIAALSRICPPLRRALGWAPLGAPTRLGDATTAIASGVAQIGTEQDVSDGGKWRVHRASLGTKGLTLGLSLLAIYYLFGPEDSGGMSVAPLPKEVLALVGVIFLWGNLYVWRFRVATNGSVLRVHGVLGGPKRYALDKLATVQEDQVHSFRLGFNDGRAVTILKSVAGARQLRQLLADTLERNQRG